MRSVGFYPCGTVDRFPAFEHPLPAVGCVEPAQRMSCRRRRLVIPRVVSERFSQCRAPGRCCVLISNQLGLCGQRKPANVFWKRQTGHLDASLGKLLCVEPIAAVDELRQRF